MIAMPGCDDAARRALAGRIPGQQFVDMFLSFRIEKPDAGDAEIPGYSQT